MTGAAQGRRVFGTLAVAIALSFHPAFSFGQFVDSPSADPLSNGALPGLSVEDRLESLERANQWMVDRVFEVEQENARLKQVIGESQRAASDAPPSAVEESPSPWQPPSEGTTSAPANIPAAEPVTRKGKPSSLSGKFDEGFKWKTADEQFELQFHNETQLDIRAYGDPHPDPVNRFGFYIPRVRFIFNGHLTEPIEYNVSINKGLGSLDLLDAYFNFKYDKRLQFRIGRYRVPYTYDWFALSNQFLVTPERSVFALNYGYNRNFAAMLHGELFDEEIDYALAVANGPRNSYFDSNSDKDLLGYLNVRPFRNMSGWEQFRNLNLGGSFAYGYQNSLALPVSFRTSANATESVGTLEGVPSFLDLHANVVERGLRSLWDLHAAWYWKQLSLLGALDGGYNTYGFLNNDTRVQLPTHGSHIQVGYFLTGEEVERRTFVEPLHPFDPSMGEHGLGAIELAFRFDHFDVGQQVFSQGLADPADWTNHVDTTDVGVNWYLNKYVKIDFDWQHSNYHRAVAYAPGRTHHHSDLFWTRFQVYF